MSQSLPQGNNVLVVLDDQPLVAIPITSHGRTITYYLANEVDNRETSDIIRAAIATAGAFSDLDWEDTLADLDRIRHQSRPTPPIDLDL
jgi:hypothetical protein